MAEVASFSWSDIHAHDDVKQSRLPEEIQSLRDSGVNVLRYIGIPSVPFLHVQIKIPLQLCDSFGGKWFV